MRQLRCLEASGTMYPLMSCLSEQHKMRRLQWHLEICFSNMKPDVSIGNIRTKFGLCSIMYVSFGFCQEIVRLSQSKVTFYFRRLAGSSGIILISLISLVGKLAIVWTSEIEYCQWRY
jgi:hypothetical protein